MGESHIECLNSNNTLYYNPTIIIRSILWIRYPVDLRKLQYSSSHYVASSISSPRPSTTWTAFSICKTTQSGSLATFKVCWIWQHGYQRHFVDFCLHLYSTLYFWHLSMGQYRSDAINQYSSSCWRDFELICSYLPIFYSIILWCTFQGLHRIVFLCWIFWNLKMRCQVLII